jgi:hypothetical protein
MSEKIQSTTEAKPKADDKGGKNTHPTPKASVNVTPSKQPLAVPASEPPKPVKAVSTAPQAVETLYFHEALPKLVDDPRYRPSWDAAISQYASGFNFKEKHSLDEWRTVFKNFGLNVKN